MPRLGSILVYDLLEIAETLAASAGTLSLRTAARRRSVSTAYYAVFHALCFVCSDELGQGSDSEDLDLIYRSVEHGFARKQLASKRAEQIGTQVLRIGSAFTDLQKRRHSVDYMPPGQALSLERTQEGLAIAQQTITAIEDLDEKLKRRMAILLIARPRAD